MIYFIISGTAQVKEIYVNDVKIKLILVLSTRPNLFVRSVFLLNFLKVFWVCEIHSSEILYSINIGDGKYSQLFFLKM